MLTFLERGLDAISWMNVAIVLLVGLVGWAAWEKTLAHSSEKIYRRIVQATEVEVEALQERMFLMEQENQHLKQLLETSKYALARRGLCITESGEAGEEFHS